MSLLDCIIKGVDQGIIPARKQTDMFDNFDMHPNDQNPGFNLEENGDTYHMKEPVLLNTKSWHWVWNKSNEARSVLSFDINKTPYLDTIDILKKNKWA